MTPFFAVAAVLALGWGAWRLLGDRGGGARALVGSTLLGIVAMAAWMVMLGLAGVRWTAISLLLPALAALAAGVFLRRSRRPVAAAEAPSSWGWRLAAVAGVGARVVAAAITPAFGWDFRYIWGLKARAFALAGGHDGGWLAWPGNHFSHPSYPPAWSDLLASGSVLGASVETTAAVWQAVLIAALAAVCWQATASCPPWLRALAAIAAAWSPVIGDPRSSGNAEPLLAFVAAAGLAALPAMSRGDATARTQLTAATAALALTKNEGAALAVGLVAAAALAGGLRRAWPALAALAAALAGWWLALPGGLARGDLRFAPSLAIAVRHATELPAALLAAVAEAPVIAFVAAAWIVCLLSWWGSELRGVRVAVGVWGVAVALAYLTTTQALAWHLATSADRVLAAPLPGVLALVLGATFSGSAAATGPPAPARSRGGSPSA